MQSFCQFVYKRQCEIFNLARNSQSSDDASLLCSVLLFKNSTESLHTSIFLPLRTSPDSCHHYFTSVSETSLYVLIRSHFDGSGNRTASNARSETAATHQISPQVNATDCKCNHLYILKSLNRFLQALEPQGLASSINHALYPLLSDKYSQATQNEGF